MLGCKDKYDRSFALCTIFLCVNSSEENHKMLLKAPARSHKWTLSYDFLCQTNQVAFIEKHLRKTQ